MVRTDHDNGAVRLVRAACLALTLIASLCSPLQKLSAARSPATPSVATLLSGIKEVNYYPATSGWTYMWANWNPSAIDADFARIATLHANTVRIIVQTGAFGYPTPQPTMLGRLAQMVSLAASHSLRVHLTLFDWWSSYTDLVGSRQWAQAVVGSYAGDPRVAVVELQNEINPANMSAMAWARQMIPYLQHLLGGIPVTVSLSSAVGPTGMQTLSRPYSPLPLISTITTTIPVATCRTPTQRCGTCGRSSHPRRCSLAR